MTLRFEPSLFFSRCVGAADEAHGSDGSFCYGLRWRPPKCFAGETPCRRGDGSFSPGTSFTGDFGSCFIWKPCNDSRENRKSLCSLWCDSCAFFGSLQLKRVRVDMSLCSQCKCTKTAINNDRCRITKQSNTNTIRLQCVQTLYVYVIWIYMSI